MFIIILKCKLSKGWSCKNKSPGGQACKNKSGNGHFARTSPWMIALTKAWAGWSVLQEQPVVAKTRAGVVGFAEMSP